jgi:hypothetical protein
MASPVRTFAPAWSAYGIGVHIPFLRDFAINVRFLICSDTDPGRVGDRQAMAHTRCSIPQVWNSAGKGTPFFLCGDQKDDAPAH